LFFIGARGGEKFFDHGKHYRKIYTRKNLPCHSKLTEKLLNNLKPFKPKKLFRSSSLKGNSLSRENSSAFDDMKTIFAFDYFYPANFLPNLIIKNAVLSLSNLAFHTGNLVSFSRNDKVTKSQNMLSDFSFFFVSILIGS
jgi:hypothetical protein